MTIEFTEHAQCQFNLQLKSEDQANRYFNSCCLRKLTKTVKKTRGSRLQNCQSLQSAFLHILDREVVHSTDLTLGLNDVIMFSFSLIRLNSSLSRLANSAVKFTKKCVVALGKSKTLNFRESEPTVERKFQSFQVLP